jgi:ribose/xylose/arabinose/galactoside ABC-type transport system permease subunit
VVALIGVLMVYCVTMLHMPPFIALIMALAGGALLGGVSGSFIVKFGIPPFIATLAMMSVGRGIARFLVNDRSITASSELFKAVGYMGTIHINGERITFALVPLLAMLAVFIVTHVIATRTRFGRYVYAIGGNEDAARLSGINTKRITLMVYAICGGLAGLSGILMASRSPMGGAVGDPKVGQMWELDAIASVVVGGTSLSGGRGTIIGTLVGALLIGVLNNGLNLLNIPDYWQMVVKGVVILAAVLLDQLKNKN